jgi:hypothetical protein
VLGPVIVLIVLTAKRGLYGFVADRKPRSVAASGTGA